MGPYVLPETFKNKHEHITALVEKTKEAMESQDWKSRPEDSSMIKLGMMLEDGGLTYEKYKRIKGGYKTRTDTGDRIDTNSGYMINELHPKPEKRKDEEDNSKRAHVRNLSNEEKRRVEEED